MLPFVSVALLGLGCVRAAPTSAELPVSEHTLDLKTVGLQNPSSSALQELVVGSAPLKSVEGGGGYGVSVQVGDQTFETLFDTGSSDLWIAQQGYTCVNSKGKPVSQSTCAFPKLYTGTYEEGQIKGENFLIPYGSGEVVAGSLGYNPVTLGGITVKKQEMSLVDEAYFTAQNSVSGIFGFAYSALTSAYHGTNPKQDTPSRLAPYSNWLASAISEKLIAPIFSVVLKSGGTGTVTLGGVPAGTATKGLATATIEKFSYQGHNGYTFYYIQTGGLVLNGKNTGAFPGVVDTGTTLLYVPKKQAAAINAAFSPPSKFDPEQGVYLNECKAKAPSLALNIGGVNLAISAADLLLPAGPPGICVSGVQPSSEPFAILGDVFLKNVVAVFNVGKSQMQFAPQ